MGVHPSGRFTATVAELDMHNTGAGTLVRDGEQATLQSRREGEAGTSPDSVARATTVTFTRG